MPSSIAPRADADARIAVGATMDRDAPIGVFDSGVGGLSVLRAIHDAMPAEHLLYLADSAHAPYGDREADFVRERASWVADSLVADGAKAIVIACNTASVLASASLRARLAVPVVAMEPAIKPAVARSRTKVIGVLATRQTLASAAVRRLCALHGASTRIVLQPCPGLVERIEAGDLDGPLVRALLTRYAAPSLEAGADVLVLGCTHYPFVAPLLREIVGPGVTLIDAAEPVAAELARRIVAREADADAPVGTVRFRSTASGLAIDRVFSMAWGGPVVTEGAPTRDASSWPNGTSIDVSHEAAVKAKTDLRRRPA